MLNGASQLLSIVFCAAAGLAYKGKFDPPPVKSGPTKGKQVHIQESYANFDSSRAHAEQPVEIGKVDVSKSILDRVSSTSRYGRFSPQAAAILPDGDQAFHGIFGRPPRLNEQSEVSKHRSRYAEKGIRILGDVSVDRKKVVQLIRRMADSGAWPLVIIGHSEFKDGDQVLFLPNGEVRVVDLHQEAATVGVPLLVLTCHGRDFEITHEITYDDAFKMWSQALDATRSVSDAAGPESMAATETFLESLAISRSIANARYLVLTASAPADDEFSFDSGGFASIWRIPMQRPSRVLWIVGLMVSGLGLIHYTVWRDGERAVLRRPDTPEEFRSAMIAFLRHASRWKWLGLELLFYAGLIICAVWLSVAEIRLDRVEGTAHLRGS